MSLNSGDFKVQTKKLSSISTKCFDAVVPCQPDICELASRCPYVDAVDEDPETGSLRYAPTRGVGNKCEVRRSYIDGVFKTLNEAVSQDGRVLNIVDAHRVGLLILPLYNSLMDFKLAVLGANGSIYHGKGANPAYKEMRATIKMIDDMLKDLGLGSSGSYGTDPTMKRAGKPVPHSQTTEAKGNSNIYAEVLQGGK